MFQGRSPLCAGLMALFLGGSPAFAQDARADSEAPGDGGERRALGEAGTEAGADAPRHGAAPEVGGAPEVHPPELIERVEAAYPEGARAAGKEGSVVLRLTIDAGGRVTRAEVATPAGHGLDEAAREAALRFRFTPARRGEQDVASRILYRYDFRLPEPPAAASQIAQAASPGAQAASPGAQAASPGAQAASPGAAGRAADTAPGPAPAPARPPLEVSVRGASVAERLRRSAEAVHVIDTEAAQRQSADLGEVLSRSEGVGVRRGGGLGSSARLSLNGLADDQVRLFLDGVPLDLSGYAFGIANVPVNLVERAEIYRGVVPVRFGADALGGAVNLVTDRNVRGSHAAASYQVGSFGTYRLTLGGHHVHEPSGLVARANGFLDHARNDYPVDVELVDEQGRLSPARVRRFHDGYRAAGGGVEVGVVRRPWADRLLLRAFYAAHERDVQHNLHMTVPYGDVTFGRQTGGAHLRYAQPLSRAMRLDTVAGYAYARTDFRDLGTCRYDWSGRCLARLPQPGESDARAIDQRVHHHTALARLNLLWVPAPDHLVRFGAAPTFATRTGRNRAHPEGVYDPLTARRDLLSAVAGVEHEARPLEGRLANIAFAKGYVQALRTEEQLPSGLLRDLDRGTFRMGVGDSLRFRFTEALYAKASYELATRLPSPEELFGADGDVPIVANLHLDPEVSHNVNLGVTLERADLGVGQLRFNVNAFGRFAEGLIWRGYPGVGYAQYMNVASARSLGFESSAGWTSPGEWLSLDGHVSWHDLRDTSSDERLPNRPFLFADGAARLTWPGPLLRDDALSLTWSARYVHEFFLGLGKHGSRETKEQIPSQLSHALALTYLVKHGGWSVSSTLEVQNLTDAKTFDYHGVQRPGRAAYAKLTLDM
ncbi:TonB family protein [Sorangium cellulosum]|uniref:TonB family protein n=2 Tax=Sorangium cellulosum TaxID=56 RepID=A0A4P2Q1K9_SORCE|nr:TonB family protein [Sorangium cellulosum]